MSLTFTHRVRKNPCPANPIPLTSKYTDNQTPIIDPDDNPPCHCTMSGFKRDWSGNAKRRDGPKPAPKQVVRNAYTPMFESLRNELDEHHDRRERIVKASRDITALSKKM